DGWTIVRKALHCQHWLPADAESRLGGCLTKLKQFDEAELLLGGSYDKLASAPGTPPARRIQALERHVRFYEAAGQPEKAAEWRRKFEAEKKIENKPGP